MRVSVLASGSTGNTSLIETPQHKVLMDAGLSGKKIASLLADVGVDIKEIDMVFLSHDHSDHSKGLGVLMRRYPQIAAFSNSGTWSYLTESQKIGQIPVEQINVIEPGQTKTFGDLDVTAFATSHDAAEPQYYVFTSGGKRMAFLTDTGYVSSKVKDVIWNLKQRILSDVGHLSNEDAAMALLDVVSSKTKRIYMAHRSQHNNTAKLAYDAAKQILINGDAPLPSDVQLIMTDADKPTNLEQI